VTVKPAVFLDRDGTIIHDVGYLSRVEDVRWFPWSIDAIRLLNRAGFLVCVTTNQGGIGLGFYGEDLVHRVHAEMAATVDAAGGRIDGFYHCPHHPVAVVEALRVECDCRKPRPGMIRQAEQQFAIDLARSFVVGDKIADVGLATNVGARGLLVKTGYGHAELERHGGDIPGAAFVADTVFEAVSWILTASGFPKEDL
jgi:D-glycero-D-manno-heptose 1,7-bisphosphate phosphatase